MESERPNSQTRLCKETGTLAIAWIAINALDFAITWLALAEGAREANALMNAFGVNDIWSLALWKAGGVLASLVAIEYLTRGGRLNGRRVLKWANLAMICLCLWNLMVLNDVVT